MPDEAGLMSLKEAADYLSVTERFMRDVVTFKKIPYHKVGKLIRFNKKDLDAFLEAGRVEAAG